VKRGDIVSVVLPRDFGKPRPAVVVQDDAFEGLPTVTLLPFTSDLQDAHLLRIGVEPTSNNGLDRTSQVQIDKVTTVRAEKVGGQIGTLDAALMRQVDEALGRFLGIT
jgi:mRNA interferase MazF